MNPVMVKRILTLGAPIALQDFLVSISFLVILAIVNGMGLIASAGLGIAEKLCGFVMLVPSSYMQSMSAFVAQNVGAKKLDRAKKALAWGIATSLLAGIFMGYFSFFHGEIMAGIFADAKEVEVIGAALFSIGLATPASSRVQILLCLVCFWRINRKNTSV